jgi:hypothetical protein
MRLGRTWLNYNYSHTESLLKGAVLANVVPGLTINGMNVQVDVVKLDSEVQIRSSTQGGTLLGYNKVVSQKAKFTPYTLPAAFDYGIVCGGTFAMGGSGGVTSNLKLHANGALSVSGNAGAALDITSSTSIAVGNNKTVFGSVKAPVLDISAQATVTGTKTVAAVPLVEIPDLDLSAYYDTALVYGQVYTGIFTNANYTPPGGVVWVNGDVKFSGGPGTHFNGTIIATGEITNISGQVDVNGPPGGLAVASLSGDIKITTSGTIDGLIYCKAGNYSQTANGYLTGQLVVKGNISKGGVSDVIVYKKSDPKKIFGSGGAEGEVTLVAGSWQVANVMQ